MQAAGIFNAANHVVGMQSAGIANEAETVHGAQFAAIYNRAEKVRGLQIGIYNQTKTLNGVQFGLINKVDSIEKGVSIGLLNFLKKDRFHELEFSINTFNTVNTVFLNYRLGGSVFHGIIGAGTNWERGHVEMRLGFGNMTKLVDNVYLQSSIYAVNSSYYRRDMWLSYQDNWSTFSCGLAYYWGEKIGIKITPNLNIWGNWNYKNHFFDNTNSLRDRMSWNVSLDVGLSIKL
jgi:hypothetical protein